MSVLYLVGMIIHHGNKKSSDRDSDRDRDRDRDNPPYDRMLLVTIRMEVSWVSWS